ncbi:MAG: polyhydroxyalkanoic acid system family protein [Caulobacteraceae bacterium]
MSTPITLIIPHKLGRAEARSRVEASLGRFKDQMSQVGMGKIQHAWTEDRLGFHAQAFGQTITGRIDVRDSDLKIEVDLPAFLAAFADRIAGKLKKEGTLLLEKK